MKIITKSNFGLESFVEEIVAENVNEFLGEELVENWNNIHWHEYSGFYLKLVDDDYVLYDGYKELMGE